MTTTRPRQLRYVPLDDLVPAERNPRGHDLPTLRRSMERWGYTNPIMHDGRTGRMAAGHGRLETLAEWQASGGEPPEGIVTSRRGSVTRWLVPVIYGWKSADDLEFEAYVIADNAIGEGLWRREPLADMLTDLQLNGRGLDGTGYTRPGLEDLLASLGRPPLPGTSTEEEGDEAQPGSPIRAVCEPGDLWQLGRHRLLIGDAAGDESERGRLFDGARPAVAYMDPPYGMALQTDYKQVHRREKTRWGESNTFEKVEGDDKPYDAGPLIVALADAREQFWWGADYYRDTIPGGGSWLCWDKRSHDDEPKFDNVLGNHFELCWSAIPHRRRLLRHTWSGLHGVHGIGEDHRRLHPTQKPVALHLDILSRYAREGETVCDLYAGSGSTLLACERLGLQCVTAELSAAYGDVICWRWQRATGQLPTRNGDPEDFSTAA